jgi:hypothetical protein
MPIRIPARWVVILMSAMVLMLRLRCHTRDCVSRLQKFLIAIHMRIPITPVGIGSCFAAWKPENSIYCIGSRPIRPEALGLLENARLSTAILSMPVDRFSLDSSGTIPAAIARLISRLPSHEMPVQCQRKWGMVRKASALQKPAHPHALRFKAKVL